MDRLMLVDDEPSILRSLRLVLGDPSREIEVYTDPKEALMRAQTATFDLIMSDFRMPQMDGVQFLTEIKKLQPAAMRLILSGYAELEGVLKAINQAEIYRFVCKPWDDHDLKTTVQRALDHHHVVAENQRLLMQVRMQRDELKKHRNALERLEADHPELVKVTWEDDGSIVLEDHAEQG